MTVSIEIHSFAADEAPAKRLAQRLGVPHDSIGLHLFPDEETLAHVPTRRLGTVVLFMSLDRPNPKLFPLLQAVDAYRRLGIERVVLVAPYLCYLRQDGVFHPGEALSRDVIGRILGEAFDRIVTVQAHVHRTANLAGLFHTPVDNLSIGAELAAVFDDDAPRLVLGPDVESTAEVEAAAGELRAAFAHFTKIRSGDRDVRFHLPASVEVTGQSVLLVDDVCSTGATLAGAAKRLLAKGAATIDVAIAHALFDQSVSDLLRTAGVRRIVSSDSISHPTNSLSLAGVLADALRQEVKS